MQGEGLRCVTFCMGLFWQTHTPLCYRLLPHMQAPRLSLNAGAFALCGWMQSLSS